MSNEYDPLDPRRLQERARSVFARAARMQDLHGQAQAAAKANRTAPVAKPIPGQETTAFSPDHLLAHGAGLAMAHTLYALNTAAMEAAQIAQSDPLMARLNVAINGTELLAEAADAVVDVTATEVHEAGNYLTDNSTGDNGGEKPPSR